jgi:hypothetical protein
MSKTEKIWMWIFIAMFAVPEILWGNLIKVFGIYFFPIYKNIQFFIDTPSLAFLVIAIEIIGVSGVFYIINKKQVGLPLNLKYVFNIVLVIIFLVLLASLYLSYVATQISFP